MDTELARPETIDHALRILSWCVIAFGALWLVGEDTRQGLAAGVELVVPVPPSPGVGVQAASVPMNSSPARAVPVRRIVIGVSLAPVRPQQ